MTRLRSFGLCFIVLEACRGGAPEPVPDPPAASASAAAPVESAAATLTAPVRVPGTTTTLQPPLGFSAATKFPGFQREELQASLMVTEMPAPFQEIVKGVTKDVLASHGISVLSSKPQELSGRPATLLKVAQTLAGTEFLKWMLVAGNERTTATIVGTFPKASESQLGEALRRSVLSASWSATGPADPFEGLSFRVKTTPRLKLAGRVSNTLMFTESGNPQPRGPDEALYIVGSSHSDAPIQDLAAFSRARAKQTTTLKELGNFTGHDLKVDSLPAYELLADAKDAKTGAAQRLYQVIALDGAGYFMVQGLAGAKRSAELLPEFRAMASSLRRVAAP